MQEWLIHTVTEHQYLVYGIIILISCVEGPIMALLGGLLLKLGYFSFIPLYFALMAGELIGDICWYWIGYRFGHKFIARFGKYFSITENVVSTVTRIFHKYTNRILIINKLTMGLGFAVATLITAGIAKIPFKQYITLNFFGQFLWTAFLLVVGHSLGQLYVAVDNVLGKVSIVASIILIFMALIGYGKYVRNRIIETSQS